MVKRFKAKHKIVDQWENTTYEIVEKLKDVPIYRICELPKPEENHDKSHPLCTRVVHQNMLFPLVWMETYTPEDRENDRELPDHEACMPHDEPTYKTNPMKNLVYNLQDVALRTSYSILS